MTHANFNLSSDNTTFGDVVASILLLLFLVLISIAADKVDAAETAIFSPPPLYRKIAAEEGVPPFLFFAMIANESNAELNTGNFMPWPWTLNVRGKSYYFETRQNAYKALLQHLNETESVDIGFGQVNWRYHKSALLNPWRALDPIFNLHCAAKMLREQYEETHDWWIAVGRYHSPSNEQRAQDYRNKVKLKWEKFVGNSSPLYQAAL